MPKPTTYKPEYCDEVEKYMKHTGRENQELPTVEGFARHLGLWRSTLYDWENLYPDFKQALDVLRSAQKEQLMNDGLYGGKEVNSTMAIFLLKVNHDMIEKTAMDITSAGKGIAPMVVLDTQKE